MISHEARRRLRIALVEPRKEGALGLCDWIAKYGYEPMWVSTVEDLRVECALLAVDAVVLGPSFSHSCPPCRQLDGLCPNIPILVAEQWPTARVGPVLQSCRRGMCAALTDGGMCQRV